MSSKYLSFLGYFTKKCMAFKTFQYKINYTASYSTKRNKNIIEKPLPPVVKQKIPENVINKIEMKENDPKIINNMITEELKTKRYIYNEKEEKMTEIDLSKKNLKDSEKNEKKEVEEKLTVQKTERLSKYLSRSGICSRREAERLIKHGMVFVDKKKINSNIAVNESSDIKIFTKNGEKAPLKEESKLWIFYKPRGLICTLSDPQKRMTIYEYLKEKTTLSIEHIISVGRLDFNSEGLLLITNDGELAHVLEIPENKMPRSYHVRVYGTLTQEKLIKIRKGVIIKGVQYGPFWTEIMSRQTSNTWLHIKMESGKNREIRRVMQKFDLRVNRLKRISFGPYRIGRLIPGDLVEIAITPEIKKLLYFNIRSKLKELNENRKDKLTQKNEILPISSEKKKELEHTKGDLKLAKRFQNRGKTQMIENNNF